VPRSTNSLKKTTDTWVRELNAAGVPCGPIYSIEQMFEDAQVEHLCIAQDIPNAEDRHIRLVLSQSRCDGRLARWAARPLELDERTDEVLAEFGFSANEIVALEKTRSCELQWNSRSYRPDGSVLPTSCPLFQSYFNLTGKV
jgi:crotonobetainyl-CoA:carnitine CoA-transferase CaiB-like acyl-CoA transferase